MFAVHRETELVTTLSLYSHRNYKWDLKQELRFDKGVKITSFEWITCEKSHIALQVITSVNELTYYFNWGVDCTAWLEGVENGTLAVIDGKVLRLTDIGNELKPPPLSTLNYRYPSPVNFVKFSPNGRYKVVVLSDNIAYVSDYNGYELYKIPIHLLVDVYNEIPLSLNNFLIDNDMNLFFVKASDISCSVFRVRKPVDNTINFDSHVCKIHELDARVTCLALMEDMLFTRNNEDNLIYKLEDPGCIENIPSSPEGEITALRKNNTNYVFCRSENNFYFNKSLIMNNITSYLICHDYIMITTTDEKLLCYELNVKDLQKLQNSSKENIFIRPIPKGSVLITAIPGTTSIVFQMERGDLEIIKPRILSVRLVKKLLSEKKFKEAFFVVKEDRLNTDILVDLNPEQFLENITEFVSSFTDNEALSLFITGLQDENIINKLYKNCIPREEIIKSLSKKRSTILNKLIETMTTVNHCTYLQSIITANIMLNSYEGMENAVKELNWGLSEQALSVDEIFHRVVPLTTSEDLLKAALSVQDFKLIQWIANKTQLDPLEYIPFFKELHKMEPNYKSYKINNYLKRYDLAFEHLIKCDNVETEIIHLLDKGNLYKLAIQRVFVENQWYSKIIEKCAEHLSSNRHYTEAGLLYKKIDKYHEAFECFINAPNFVEFINLSEILREKGNVDSLRGLLERFAIKLKEVGKIKEAAVIYEKMNFYEEGIVLLISCKEWDEAMQYILKNGRKDMIGNFISILFCNNIC